MSFSKDASKNVKPFREGLFHVDEDKTGYLIGSRCNRCNLVFFPSRDICNNCFRDDQIKVLTLSKTGILHTFTTVYQSRPGLKVPYSIGFIDLKDGVRIFAPLFDVTAEELKIGMEMELMFRNMIGASDQQEETLVYGFKPVKRDF